MKNRALKFLLLFLSGFFMCVVMNAQNTQIDQRLEKGYTREYLERIQKESPVILDLLNYELDHSWYIESSEMVQKINDFDYLYYKDPETGEKAGIVENIELGKVNIAEFYYERGYQYRTFYRVGKTNTIIGFYSNKEMSEMYNAKKGYSNE